MVLNSLEVISFVMLIHIVSKCHIPDVTDTSHVGGMAFVMTSPVGVFNHEEINWRSLFRWMSLLGILVLLSIMKTMWACKSWNTKKIHAGWIMLLKVVSSSSHFVPISGIFWWLILTSYMPVFVLFIYFILLHDPLLFVLKFISLIFYLI